MELTSQLKEFSRICLARSTTLWNEYLEFWLLVFTQGTTILPQPFPHPLLWSLVFHKGRRTPNLHRPKIHSINGKYIYLPVLWLQISTSCWCPRFPIVLKTTCMMSDTNHVYLESKVQNLAVWMYNFIRKFWAIFEFHRSLWLPWTKLSSRML